MSNLQLRVISSVVLIVAVLAVTFLGGVAFRLALGADCGRDVLRMVRDVADRDQRLATSCVAAALLGVVLLALVLGYSGGRRSRSARPVGPGQLRSTAGSAGQGLWAPAGLAYAGLSGRVARLASRRRPVRAPRHPVPLRRRLGDRHFGLFRRTSLGGPKLAPSISPGKTQSGAIGGTVGGVVAGIALAAYAGLGNLPLLALVALLLSVVSQVGDLFESWVKRRHGVKDSGNIIPGHGGVMDRVDGLVAAAFALYAIGSMLGSADKPAQALFAI